MESCRFAYDLPARLVNAIQEEGIYTDQDLERFVLSGRTLELRSVGQKSATAIRSFLVRLRGTVCPEIFEWV